MMEKIKINMLSQATSVDGQGVGSAYVEQLALVKENDDIFEVAVNSKRGNFDIYHMHTFNPQYVMRLNKRHINVTYVHCLPDTFDGSLKMPKPIFRLFKKYVKHAYLKADEAVVVNPIFIEPLVRLGLKRENITYIPNFVDHEKFHELSSKERNVLRDKYNIPHDKFVVMGCGQVQTRKGVKDYVECAKRNPDMVFVWAGGFSFGAITDGYKELKAIMDKPPKNVKFIGIVPRKEMNGIFNMSDVLFMPSFDELFPMSILEAVNSRKPVLLRDLELYKDILFYDKDTYAKAADVEGFCEQLSKLASDKEYYEHYQKGSEIIKNFYSKEHVKNLWREYYLRIYDKWAPVKKLKSWKKRNKKA